MFLCGHSDSSWSQWGYLKPETLWAILISMPMPWENFFSAVQPRFLSAAFVLIDQNANLNYCSWEKSACCAFICPVGGDEPTFLILPANFPRQPSETHIWKQYGRMVTSCTGAELCKTLFGQKGVPEALRCATKNNISSYSWLPCHMVFV